ncbi:hypothetical protein [uncultured Sphingomonas sp.]|uniref:hypothetical protein n=1 Tax=uncultured Sphingomonas sp. TaxID=158754 RepID=UPI0035CBB104
MTMTTSLDETSMSNIPATPQWTDDELRTLVSFRKRHGRRWKSKLLDLYLFGKDDSEPDGAGLRRIRNRHGPSRVHALKTSALDAAEARLSAEPGRPS